MQVEKNQLLLRQAQDQERVAGTRLAQTLGLDPTVELAAQETELLRLTLIQTNAALDSLGNSPSPADPEFKTKRIVASASQETQNRARGVDR